MMTDASNGFDLRTTIHGIVPNIFETMLSLATFSADASAAPTGERVSGTIGMAGETISGTMYLHFSEPLARRAAAAMLGSDPLADIDTVAVNDVVSELTNMIGGNLKSVLSDAGWPCAMSTPAIVRGQTFSIEFPKGLCSETFVFDCHGEALAVEVHLKLN